MSGGGIMGLADVLALALSLVSCVTMVISMIISRRWVSEYRTAAREEAARAALAENALAQTRQKRSNAVSKGNRTRAQRHRDKVRAKAAEIREAIAEKAAPPQGALPLMVPDQAADGEPG